LPRLHAREHLLQTDWAIFKREPAAQVRDHLPDGDRLLVDLDHGPRAYALEHLLERLHQVNDVGGDLRFGAFRLHELTDCGVRTHRVFDLLLLEKHLSGGLELLVLDQPVHQFRARVFLRFRGDGRIARQQHLRLDVNQDRGHVDELGRNINVQFSEAFYVGQILRSDLRDGDVVNVDVLLADEIEQEIEWAFVDIGDADGEGKVAVVLGRNRDRTGTGSRPRRIFCDRVLIFCPNLRFLRHVGFCRPYGTRSSICLPGAYAPGFILTPLCG